MRFINYNGNLINENEPIVGANNRGLRYGDGLFETISYKNGNFVLLDAHLNRLWLGMKLLQFDIPTLFTKSYITDQLNKLVLKNKEEASRVRLMVFRGDGGLYDPENLKPHFIIQSWPLQTITHELNNNGLDLCIYRDAHKSCDVFSNIKHNNYLPYFMGALYAKKQKCNDAIILNQMGNVCDSTIANIFLIKDKRILTPALQEGCVAGTMRHFLIHTLQALNYEVMETTVPVDMLANADEVFLTNAIYNIRWVKSIENTQYGFAETQKIFYQLIKTNPLVIC